MSKHVSEPALLDVLEGGGAASAREHVAACAACAARLAEATEGWLLALGADVPEPSPFYWASMRRDVGQRIESPRPTRWRVILPLSLLAAAAAAAALSIGPAVRPSTAPSPLVPAWSALPPEEADHGLPALEGLALAGGDLTPWEESEGIGPFLAGLPQEDSQALVTALRTSGGGSDR
jgi:hypothetical protein